MGTAADWAGQGFKTVPLPGKLIKSWVSDGLPQNEVDMPADP